MTASAGWAGVAVSWRARTELAMTDLAMPRVVRTAPPWPIPA
jgi:hypothetical protein